MKKLIKLSLSLAVVAAAIACTDDKPATTPDTTVTEKAPEAVKPVEAKPVEEAKPADAAAAGPAVAEAEQIFNTRCAACHGMTGEGDGMAAAALNPKPRKYSDKEWQASVDDSYIAKVIVEGGPAVGKSPLMAPNADLKDKPEVVKALVAKVRSFGK